jgi:hypothetical protein
MKYHVAFELSINGQRLHVENTMFEDQWFCFWEDTILSAKTYSTNELASMIVNSPEIGDGFWAIKYSQEAGINGVIMPTYRIANIIAAIPERGEFLDEIKAFASSCLKIYSGDNNTYNLKISNHDFFVCCNLIKLIQGRADYLKGIKRGE